MRGKIFKYWNRIRSGFWFLPSIMAGVAVASAFVSVTGDEPTTEWLALNPGWKFTGGAEGAREGLPEGEDRQAAEERYQKANQLLSEAADSGP